MYGSSDKDQRDAATDVAALANTAGGLIIGGIAEDDQARAAAAPGVALSDAEERRIRQIVAAQVVPLPVFDVVRVEDPAQPGHGLVLIAVPRSPLARMPSSSMTDCGTRAATAPRPGICPSLKWPPRTGSGSPPLTAKPTGHARSRQTRLTGWRWLMTRCGSSRLWYPICREN
jgi:hypothetical protein